MANGAPHRRARSRWLPALALAAFGCNADPVSFFPPTPAPVVTAVEIVPRTVYVAPGAVFSLPAWIKGTGGSSLRMAAFPNLEIDWWASESVIVDASTNPVEIVAPSTPGTLVDVQATVRRIKIEGATVTVLQEIVSPLATIVVSPNLTSTDVSDWVTVDHTDFELPHALLLEGRDGSLTVEDWVLGTVGEVRLGRNLLPSPSAEMALFGVDYPMDLWPPTFPAPWSTSPDDVDASGLPSPAANFRELPIRFGLDDWSTGADLWAQDQITYAFWLLGDSRLGIDPFWIESFQHNRVDALGTPLPVIDPIAACSTTNVDNDIAPFSITDAADPALYVLLVPAIGSTIRGWACTPQSNWSGRVVFVSWAEYSLSTIAHEVGHVLALAWPDIETGLGHTNGVPGFDWSNLMWSFSSEILRSKRDHLSIGQVYRMNADPESWLNQLVPLGSRMTRSCQITKGTGACPALATDLER